MIIYSWSSLLRTRRDACVICINCSMPFAFIALCDHLARFSSLCHVDSKVLMLYVRSLIVKMAYVAFVELKLSHNIPLLVNEEPPTSCHFNNKDVASSSETPWWCCQRDREETNATALLLWLRALFAKALCTLGWRELRNSTIPVAHYHHFIITSTTYALPAIAPLLPRGPIDSLRYFKLRMKQSVPSTYRTTAADIVACSVKVQTNLLVNTAE